jgi:hypothetical protein
MVVAVGMVVLTVVSYRRQHADYTGIEKKCRSENREMFGYVKGKCLAPLELGLSSIQYIGDTILTSRSIAIHNDKPVSAGRK